MLLLFCSETGERNRLKHVMASERHGFYMHSYSVNSLFLQKLFSPVLENTFISPLSCFSSPTCKAYNEDVMLTPRGT